MATPLAIPEPSYLREHELRLRARPGSAPRTVRLGLTVPTRTDDGWWLAHLWAAVGEHVIDTRDIAPSGGVPPLPPQVAMGPPFAGALAGLVAEEGGRQLVRLRLYPAADPDRPWERPLILQVAIRWDPVRAATMSGEALAGEALAAFARAIEAAGSPG